jgi:hypothetical protein
MLVSPRECHLSVDKYYFILKEVYIMANATNNNRIVELYYENGSLKFKGTVEQYKELEALGAFNTKPSTARGASKKTENKPTTPKAPKTLKTYEPFEKTAETYTAKAVESKGGNPNALLQIKFNGKPNPKTIALLKAYGYRWNKANGSWDNANSDDAKEIFIILK